MPTKNHLDADSPRLPVTVRVRQGCVLSSCLFAAVMELGIQDWRLHVKDNGLVLGDGAPNLVNLRFADDISSFYHVLLMRRTPHVS